MNLTERERIILQLSRQGLSDYRIARKINTDPPSVTRSRKNAQRKLVSAAVDLDWALREGVNIADFDSSSFIGTANLYNFFL